MVFYSNFLIISFLTAGIIHYLIIIISINIYIGTRDINVKKKKNPSVIFKKCNKVFVSVQYNYISSTIKYNTGCYF